MHRNKEFINIADLIRSDVRLLGKNGQIISSSEIDNRERFIAQELQKTLAFRRQTGFTVFINYNDFDWVLPALKATWRLGGNIFVHDFHVGYTSIPEFRTFYDFVNIVINSKVVHERFAEKEIVQISAYDKTRVYDTVTSPQHVNGQTVAVKTHSSGTTGIPKIIDYDHNLVRDLTTRLIPLFDFSDQDRPLHWKTLHHASLFLNYAIPLLAVCRDHWYVSSIMLSRNDYTAESFFQFTLPFCKEQGITRLLVPYDWITNLGDSEPIDLEGKLVLHCIRGLKKNQPGVIFQKFNPKSIVDIFGCSEQGVMFIKNVDRTNWETFEPGMFDTVTPDLEYKIFDTFIQARWPDRPWNTIGDIFKSTDQGLKYIGRSYTIIVDNETVAIDPLDKYLKSLYADRQYQLVVDFECNAIYLAFFDDLPLPTLDELNVRIAQNCHPKLAIQGTHKFDIASVNVGMKPSAPILLYAFRQGIQLAQDKNLIEI